MRDDFGTRLFVTKQFLFVITTLIVFLGTLLISYSDAIGEALLLNRIMVHMSENWSPEYTFFNKCGSAEFSGNLAQEYAMLQRIGLRSVPMRVVDGRILWLTGRCSEAAAVWATLAQEHTKHPVPLAWLLAQTNDYDLVSAAERAILGKFALMQGARFQDRKDTQSAQTWYSRAFLLFPSWETARVLVGFYSAVGNQTEKIIEIWQSLLDTRDESSADFWWARAELGALNSDWQSAAKDFEKGALLATSPYEFFLRAGDSWYSAGASENAIAAYLQASEVSPGNGRPFLRIGDMEAGQGNDEVALSWYTRSLEINPDDPAILQVVAQTYYKLGDRELAVYYVQRALDLSPEHPWSLYLLAQLKADNGELSLAVDMALRSLIAYQRPSKPSTWLEKSLEWALDAEACQDAQSIFDLAQADQLSTNIIGRFKSDCTNE